MRALKSRYLGHSERIAKSTAAMSQSASTEGERLVVAHFMLGNTYPFTETDWETTLDLAEDTALDGFALNLGQESWQHDQALSGFDILERRSRSCGAGGPARPFRMFLSLDMNVLRATTPAEAADLVRKTAELMKRREYLTYGGKKVLSTFGGHDKTFGAWGWTGFLERLEREVGEEVLFIPAFFLPPNDILKLPFVDGCFPWNNAWSLGNRPNDLREDEPFLQGDKVHMAAVSPLFFTHYGTTGQWAFKKNWIYPSDDLLLPTRFSQLIRLPPDRSPHIIQVISWNDHGESHAIAPVLGAEPGSDSWTKGMDHIAFREMVKYYATIWRDSGPIVPEREARVWMWYRTHPAAALARDDEVGRPSHVEQARDQINIFVPVPANVADLKLKIQNSGTLHCRPLAAGQPNMFTVPFIPGPVSFELATPKGILLRGEGRRIDAEIDKYNFNMWTGSWRVAV